MKLIAEQWKLSDENDDKRTESERFEAASEGAPGEPAPSTRQGTGTVHFVDTERVDESG